MHRGGPRAALPPPNVCPTRTEAAAWQRRRGGPRAPGPHRLFRPPLPSGAPPPPLPRLLSVDVGRPPPVPQSPPPAARAVRAPFCAARPRGRVAALAPHHFGCRAASVSAGAAECAARCPLSAGAARLLRTLRARCPLRVRRSRATASSRPSTAGERRLHRVLQHAGRHALPARAARATGPGRVIGPGCAAFALHSGPTLLSLGTPSRTGLAQRDCTALHGTGCLGRGA